MKRSSLKRDFVSYVDRLHFWKECGGGGGVKEREELKTNNWMDGEAIY